MKKINRYFSISILIFLLLINCAVDITQTAADTSDQQKNSAIEKWPENTLDLLNNDRDGLKSLAQYNSSKRRIYFIKIRRSKLSGNIYQYSFIFKMGPGQYDLLGIYRVVKEKYPYCPIQTKKSIMLVNQAALDFNLAFLPSFQVDGMSHDQSMALYLAENNLDVWGIDPRWTFVDNDETNLDFMKNWNIDFQLNDLKVAVKFARLARRITQSSRDKIFLGGHYSGATYPWAYANFETQKKEQQRDLKGIILLDGMYKISPQYPEVRAISVARYHFYQDLRQKGIYYETDADTLKLLVNAAKSAPEQSSPLLPGFSNLQAFMFIMSAYYTTFIPPSPSYTPKLFYHLFAGVFENNIPTGFQFIEIDQTLNILSNINRRVTNADMMELESIQADITDLPYDDYLDQITIPILSISTAGGNGKYCQYTSSLTSSQDITETLIRLYPEGMEAIDFGSADMLYTDKGKELVWKPVVKWIANQ